eukprot:gnl/TRDRNA2_/TRDRNA2_56921_c0_seq1.p1 gnl/TRDRNA2_/TRDRNA2_56921_c0~~gnl/TRDRNA2_/TRDRNA2_56921_c0_seq1.p1  ORF type:complete len:267 (+),score=110.78 gnl/TRDRNA2_/TRDRNA2_56921_c0_seq1:65-865(+)
MDAQKERSQLCQRQKKEQGEIEKKVKKLKGALKEAAQKELEELVAKHEAELAAFDKPAAAGSKKEASGYTAGSATQPPLAPAPAEEKPAKKTHFRDRNWPSLSKKELEEAAVERGVSKKGSKEELVQRLIMFQQEQGPADASAPSGASSAKKAESDDEDDDDEDEDDDDEDDEPSDDDGVEADPAEMEAQAKREKAVQKAIRFLLTEKCKEGFPAADFVVKLEMVNVKGFAPEKLGYKSIDKFLRRQPEKVMRFNKKTQMILPPLS